MKVITFVLISLALVIPSTRATCTPGCLSCAVTNMCLACDVTRGTFLSTGTCYTTTVPNCLIQGNGAATCLRCVAGFFLDPGSQSCQAVTSSIVNCAVYASLTQCRQCVDGTMMVAGQCRVVPNPIQYCRTYNADGTCYRCAPTYVVATNMTACLPLGISNCASGSFIRCRTCLGGYFYNNNNYLFNLFQFNTAAAQTAALMTFRGGPWAPQSFCSPQYQMTCIDPLSLNCLPANVQQPANNNDPNTVNNCVTYGPAYACTACAQGFKISPANPQANPPVPAGCTPVQNVNNCQTYNNANANGECTACVPGFFVNGQNQCVARNNMNIPGCITLANNQDACSACNATLVLSTDGLACFPPIPNCQSYLAITSYYPANNCILCNAGFFVNATFNATNCSNGTVPNCSVYVAYDNSCAVCAEGTYLNNGFCIPFKKIPNCLQYTITTAVQCSACNGTRIPFKQLNKCVAITPLANCIDYNAAGTACTACIQGAYLNAGACTLISSNFPGCLGWDVQNSQCNACAPGFHLVTTATPNTCAQPLDYIVGNTSRCAVVNNPQNAVWNPATTNAQIGCTQCSDNTFPYAPAFNEAICTNTAQLWYLPGYAAVTNCARYGRSLAANNPIVCLECAKGFFLSGYQALGPYTTATTCVSSCTSTTAAPLALILDDLFGFVNICVPILATGYVQLSSYCAKWIRVTAAVVTANAANYASDFVCLNSTTGTPTTTTAVPTSFLLYDTVASLAGSVLYEKQTYNAPTFIAQGAQYAPVWDFSTGFANTADTSMTYPAVFNYHGLLTATAYGGPAFIRLSAAADAIAAANIKLNNFAFCDIIANTDAVKVGNAFFGAATLYTPATIGTLYYHCFRCAFGYGLAYTGGTAAATVSPFPSCAAVTACSASQVWGGLPRFLNSILSCHVCTSTTTGASATALFPTIAFEIDGVDKKGLYVGFQPDQAYSLTGGAIVASATSGFKCAAAPSTVVRGVSAGDAAAVTGCAAYANLRVLSAWATASAAATVVTSVFSAANNNVCVACGAGTYPTYLSMAATETASITNNGLPGWVVTTCTASQYCDATATTGMFNGCPRCNTALSPAGGGSTAYNDFTFANCVYTSAMNCLLAEGLLDASQVYTCTACKAGYFLNAGGLCDMFTVPNQAANSTFVSNAFLAKVTTAWLAAPAANAFAIRDLRVAYLQKYNMTNYGANNCSTGYTRSPISANVYSLCAWSSFLSATRMRSPQTGFFVPNCRNYQAVTPIPAQAPATLKCVACVAPYIPRQDGSTCVLFAVPTLCQIAANPPANNAQNNNAQPPAMPTPQPNGTPLCFQCVPNALWINGVCFAPSIPNCLTYTQTTTAGTLPVTCATCNDTFAPTANSQGCVQGPVDGCRRYSDGVTCTSCMPGLILITLNSRPYCLPMPSMLNCTQMDAGQANQNNLQCTRCNNTNVTAYAIAPYTVSSVYNDTLDVCLPYNNISNCLIMAQAARNQQGVVQMGCQVCAPGLYWDAASFWCRPRSVLPLACITFSLNSDVCTACRPNFFLSAAGNSCTAYPVGFLNCFALSSPGTCGQCVTGFFLNGGLCIQVSRPVQNCLFYVNDGVCTQCGLGLVAVNSGTQCMQPVATNCSTWSTPSSCASCPPTMYLANSTTATAATAATAATTATTAAAPVGICLNLTVGNCSAGFANGTCTQCLPNFYLSKNQCNPIAKVINGCAIYANATACASCTPGNVLSTDNLSCIPNYFNGLSDPNCADAFIGSTPVCTACNPGYYFNTAGVCVQCGPNLTAGCAYCNPSSPDTCIECATGYTMDANQNCNVQATIPNNPVPQQQNNNPPAA